MRITIEKEFANIDDAIAFLQMAGLRNPVGSAAADLAALSKPTPDTKPKRGKAKPAPEVKVEYKVEDVQKVLDALYEAKGMQPAIDVLGRFGVKRLRDLDPAKYAELVQRVNAVIDGADA